MFKNKERECRYCYEDNIENATMNTSYCGRTKKEANTAWWNKNPNYMREYREKHPEKIKEYNDNYYFLTWIFFAYHLHH